MSALVQLGWNERLQAAWDALADSEGLVPGRVFSQGRGGWFVRTEDEDLLANLPGRFRSDTTPVVGDWVAVSERDGQDLGTIQHILPRSSSFSRKVPGDTTQEQVVAANIDTVFLVAGLDGDFSPRRLERYLTLAWNSGAKPVVVLNKVDKCEDLIAVLTECRQVALGVDLHTTSAKAGEGVDGLRQYTAEGTTVALLGSSGVGKSTIVNQLLGTERMKTGDVREADKRGRHTTTHRELLVLPGGGCLLDTPGMREIQLWGSEEGLEETFSDVSGYFAECRFRDCKHSGEPGCAVAAAVESGELSAERVESYLELQAELSALAQRREVRAKLERKKKDKKLAKLVKEVIKDSQKR
ncbi:MAG: ribosome small subunit-dependent GTPase A [Myxococcales bacterium]|nr:ribosome small subunit-dependent GTPase A [Myxococcales bacterium]